MRLRHSTVLGITPGLRAEVLGERHLREDLVGRELHEVPKKLNKRALWDQGEIAGFFGSSAVRM